MGNSASKAACIIGGVAICALGGAFVAAPLIAKGLVALGTTAKVATVVSTVGCTVGGAITGGYVGHKVHEWATTSVVRSPVVNTVIQDTSQDRSRAEPQAQPTIVFERYIEDIVSKNPVAVEDISVDSSDNIENNINRQNFFTEERIKKEIRRRGANSLDNAVVEEIYDKIEECFTCPFCCKSFFQNSYLVPCTKKHMVHKKCMERHLKVRFDLIQSGENVSYTCPYDHNEEININNIKRVDTRSYLRKAIKEHVKEKIR